MASKNIRTTGITNNSIKKRFNKFPVWRIISEYIWNGLDADAKSISISLNTNEFGGVESITIIDNGIGLNFHDPSENFDKWDDSSKNKITDRGSQGRGRYAFHKIACKAQWFIRRNNEDALITVHSEDMINYDLELLPPESQLASVISNGQGTAVHLTEIPLNKNLPDIDTLTTELSREFSWRLIADKGLLISLNGQPVPSLAHQEYLLEGDLDNDFVTTLIIRWETQPTTEKSMSYFHNCSNDTIYQLPSGFNYKDGFYLSTYSFSEWFDGFSKYDGNYSLLKDNNKTTSSGEFKRLISDIKLKSKEIYTDFLVSRASMVVDGYEAAGFFPVYKYEPKKFQEFRLKNTKNLIAKIYIADPNVFESLNSRNTKILISLLDKITVSNENDSIFDVLESVLELDQEKLDLFAKQIKMSKLDSIINTTHVLYKRAYIVKKLDYLIDAHSKNVLETPDLQRIIENNSWLFGPQYEILGAEEDDFTKIAKNLRDELPEINQITDADIANGYEIIGVKGQVDLFLARKKVSIDPSTHEQFIQCTIIEIKRPGIALNDKHLSQIERYASVIAQHKAYNGENMRFDIILLGRHVSDKAFLLNQRLKDNTYATGQVFGGTGRIRCFIKSWSEIFNEFEISNNYLLENFELQKEKYEEMTKIELVKDLQEC
ncbi:MAG: ATP-binding protein [Colwellia sp.]|nr:ATP-binding protein [Colwellia sp.]